MTPRTSSGAPSLPVPKANRTAAIASEARERRARVMPSGPKGEVDEAADDHRWPMRKMKKATLVPIALATMPILGIRIASISALRRPHRCERDPAAGLAEAVHGEGEERAEPPSPRTVPGPGARRPRRRNPGRGRGPRSRVAETTSGGTSMNWKPRTILRPIGRDRVGLSPIPGHTGADCRGQREGHALGQAMSCTGALKVRPRLGRGRRRSTGRRCIRRPRRRRRSQHGPGYLAMRRAPSLASAARAGDRRPDDPQQEHRAHRGPSSTRSPCRRGRR